MANYVHIVYHPVDKNIVQYTVQCFNDINEARKYASHTHGTANTIESYRLWSQFEIINEDEDSDILYGMQ
jgi:hypothetical protein